MGLAFGWESGKGGLSVWCWEGCCRLLKKTGIQFPGGLKSAMDEVEVARQTEQLTSETAAFFRVFSAADHGPPGFAGGFCGCGDFFQSINAFGVQHLSGNTEGTGEIAGADKEGVDALGFGDGLGAFNGFRSFDLDGEPAVAVGVLDMLQLIDRAEAAFVIGQIETPGADWRVFGPFDHLPDLFDISNLRDHDAFGPGFHGAHHRGVVRRGNTHEARETGSAAGHGNQFDLMMGDGGMFLIEPKSVESAHNSGDFDPFGAGEVAEGKHADFFAECESLFDGHKMFQSCVAH